MKKQYKARNTPVNSGVDSYRKNVLKQPSRAPMPKAVKYGLLSLAAVTALVGVPKGVEALANAINPPAEAGVCTTRLDQPYKVPVLANYKGSTIQLQDPETDKPAERTVNDTIWKHVAERLAKDGDVAEAVKINDEVLEVNDITPGTEDTIGPDRVLKIPKDYETEAIKAGICINIQTPDQK